MLLHLAPNGGVSNNMVGSLPDDVSFISKLEWFIVSKELLSGPFPDWSRLTTLEQVLVNNNGLTGTFPAFLIEQNPLLGTLHLSLNNLSGQLPAFAPSSAMIDFRLNDNNFTGPIPPEISNLASLRTYLSLFCVSLVSLLIAQKESVFSTSFSLTCDAIGQNHCILTLIS
jgi:hypothetical protein